MVDIRLEKEATRQGIGSGHTASDAKDLSKLFGESKGEAEPVVETRATVILEVNEPRSPSLLLLLPDQCMFPPLTLNPKS
ncbi:TMV resistance protein N-like [Pyrus ussuriensis x Pyrus communis]|uniref:TMV resistance protein N-like n=1 Tax=Pyrus ussuriensis x Pyrus communis TaxID=2448454 RepID=A0A5N5HMH4_9ROSA|nr:TMV resistance protein N-like [Pyrus ussuriensis x Pyrus communis]